MAEMIELKNTSRNQTFQATYYPEKIARRTQQKLFSVEKVRTARGKMATVKQPYSFEILPGGTTSVHAVALHLPQVHQALKSGWLEAVKPAVVAKSSVIADDSAVSLISKSSRGSKHGG